MIKVIFFDYLGVVNDDGLNYELLDMVHELKASYQVGLMSNESSDRMAEQLKRESIYSIFDPVILAFDYVLSKPDLAIFELACHQAEVVPSEALLIDDQQVNVDGAVAAGLQGLLYTDIAKLKKDLAALDA